MTDTLELRRLRVTNALPYRRHGFGYGLHLRKAGGGELWVNSCQTAVSYAAHSGHSSGAGVLGLGRSPAGLA
jgi:hypothetical protein